MWISSHLLTTTTTMMISALSLTLLLLFSQSDRLHYLFNWRENKPTNDGCFWPEIWRHSPVGWLLKADNLPQLTSLVLPRSTNNVLAQTHLHKRTRSAIISKTDCRYLCLSHSQSVGLRKDPSRWFAVVASRCRFEEYEKERKSLTDSLVARGFVDVIFATTRS